MRFVSIILCVPMSYICTTLGGSPPASVVFSLFDSAVLIGTRGGVWFRNLFTLAATPPLNPVRPVPECNLGRSPAPEGTVGNGVTVGGANGSSNCTRHDTAGVEACSHVMAMVAVMQRIGVVAVGAAAGVAWLLM